MTDKEMRYKTMKLRTRFEHFLAKIADENVDIETLTPPRPVNTTEELMLEIAGKQLPEVTEDDEGKVLKVVDGEWDKGEAISRAGDIYIINFIPNAENPMEISCDTTFAEVLNAWQSGKSIFAIIKGEASTFMGLSGFGGSRESINSFLFSSLSVNKISSASVLMKGTVSLYSNDTVSFDMNTYALTEV